MSNYEFVAERMMAYISPRKPETPEQYSAFNIAVKVQTEYEEQSGIADLPSGVSSVSNDGVSMSFTHGASDPAYNRENISPVAWAYLRNAGLIAYTLPTARRP